MKTYLLFAFLLFLIILSACSDHQANDPLHQWRVKSLTRILPDNNGITNISAFKYNADNKIISLISYEAPDSTAAVVGRTMYEYDSEKRLSVVKRSVEPFGSEIYKYTYDANGKPATLDYNAGDPEIYHMTFKYNGDVLESSLRKFDFNFALRFRLDIKYIFSGLNLAKVNSVQTIEKVIPFVFENSSTFTYDNKINPFYGVYMIPAPVLPAKPTFAQFYYYTYYGGYDNLLTLSANNILSQVNATGEQTNFKYEYNDAGYPTLRITEQKNAGQSESSVVETLIYEYEKY